MRSRVTGLAIALVLGTASATLAQQPAEGHKQHGKAKQSMQARGQGRGVGALLKGIELTADQKAKLQALRPARGDNAQRGDGNEAAREQLKAARERGDTAALREFRTQRAAEMKQRHEAFVRDVRAILTPAQREVFDKNVAEMQKKLEERGKRGDRGKRRSA